MITLTTNRSTADRRLLRAATTAPILALIASALLGGAALAANTRVVFFGSPGADGGGYNADGTLDYGELVNTRVTAGGKSAVTVRIENQSNSTLNKVKIAGGSEADGKPYNPAFPKPAGSSLPAGASFAAVIPLTSGVTCDPNTSASFQCDFGNLAANGVGELLVIISVPSGAGAHPYWLTASWNEGWSSTGNNADYNFAVDDLNVGANSCSGGTASWFLGSESVNLGDGGDVCFGANAAIQSGASLGGRGGFAAVAVDDGQGVPCPSGFKCFGSTVGVTIIDGAPVPGGVKWTVTWEGTKSLKGVIHYRDNYPANPTAFTVIQFNKQNQCTASKTTNCWESVTSSPGGVKPMFVTVVFYTDGNGKGGGFF